MPPSLQIPALASGRKSLGTAFIPLLHLAIPVFVHVIGHAIAIPSIADTIVAALCQTDACPQAIFVSGVQHTISGVGAMFATPYLGALSDEYGRRPLLLLCLTVSIAPFATLAYSQSTTWVWVYWVVKTAAVIPGESAIMTIVMAYIADVVPVELRATVFGWVMGVMSVGFLVATMLARVLPSAGIFLIASIILTAPVIYVIFLLPETLPHKEAGTYVPVRLPDSDEEIEGSKGFSLGDSSSPLPSPARTSPSLQNRQAFGSVLQPMAIAVESSHWSPRLPPPLETSQTMHSTVLTAADATYTAAAASTAPTYTASATSRASCHTASASHSSRDGGSPHVPTNRNNTADDVSGNHSFEHLTGSPVTVSDSEPEGCGTGSSISISMHSPAVAAGSAVITQRHGGGEGNRQYEDEGGSDCEGVEGGRAFEHGHGGGRRGKKPASTLMDSIRLVRGSRLLTMIALISFLSALSENGTHGTLLYYLKAVFHFTKDQYAQIFLVIGATSFVSQLAILPLVVSLLGIRAVLLTGLTFGALHVLMFGVATSEWMVYLAASMATFVTFITPSIGSIVSMSASADDQGKMQGLVTGTRSLASAVAPLLISPLIALFVSPRAPFKVPGFGLICASLPEFVAVCLAIVLPSLPSFDSSASLQLSRLDGRTITEDDDGTSTVSLLSSSPLPKSFEHDEDWIAKTNTVS